MSSSHDHPAETSVHGYGGGERTSRPLFALIPIGIALVIVFAMLAEGLHVMTTSSPSWTGVENVAQTTAPTAGPGSPTG